MILTNQVVIGISFDVVHIVLGAEFPVIDIITRVGISGKTMLIIMKATSIPQQYHKVNHNNVDVLHDRRISFVGFY